MISRQKAGLFFALIIMISFSISSCSVVPKSTSSENQQEQKSAVVFSGTDMSGSTIDAKSIFSENKVTMVNVWATYCQPCIQEMPELQQLSEEQTEDVAVIGILSDAVDSSGDVIQENVALGKQILEEQSVSYQNVVCDITQLQDQISIDAVPTTFFVDQQGCLIGEVQVGSVSKEEYQKMINRVLEQM